MELSDNAAVFAEHLLFAIDEPLDEQSAVQVCMTLWHCAAQHVPYELPGVTFEVADDVLSCEFDDADWAFLQQEHFGNLTVKELVAFVKWLLANVDYFSEDE